MGRVSFSSHGLMSESVFTYDRTLFVDGRDLENNTMIEL